MMSELYILLAAIGSVGVFGLLAWWLIRRDAISQQKIKELRHDNEVKTRQLEEASKPRPGPAAIADGMRRGDF